MCVLTVHKLKREKIYRPHPVLHSHNPSVTIQWGLRSGHHTILSFPFSFAFICSCTLTLLALAHVPQDSQWEPSPSRQAFVLCVCAAGPWRRCNRVLGMSLSSLQELWTQGGGSCLVLIAKPRQTMFKSSRDRSVTAPRSVYTMFKWEQTYLNNEEGNATRGAQGALRSGDRGRQNEAFRICQRERLSARFLRLFCVAPMVVHHWAPCPIVK